MSRETREAYYNSIIHRIVSLPRTILGNFSRAINQRTRINQSQNQNQNQQIPSTYHTPYLQEPVNIQEEWAFLSTFEQRFGQFHPFFYACRFQEALKIAEKEKKLLFMYLHSSEHPFAYSFCKETLCSELVVEYIDTNFVSWGGLANIGEGLHLVSTFQAFSFPFCAVVAPASGDNLAVLQQIEGPVSPAQLVEILQRTMEEQGLGFGNAHAREEERRRERREREDQDAAYLAALQIDQEKERHKNLHLQDHRSQKQEQSNEENNEKNKQNLTPKQAKKPKESTSKEAKYKDAAIGSDSSKITRILIRFPDGTRKEQSFVFKDKIQAIYTYIDSLCLPGVDKYRLISNFPRKVYDIDQMRMTLKDAGLYPKATLFLEVL